MAKLEQQISNFLAVCKEQRALSENSLKGYRQDLEAFAQFIQGRGVDAHPGQETILDYLRFLRTVREYKPATVRRRIVTLRKLYDWCSVDGGVDNPFHGLDLDLRIPKRLPRPVDRSTLEQVLSQAKPLVDLNASLPVSTQILSQPPLQITGLATRILIATGLRIGELTNLQLKDVSGAGSRIRVVGKGDRERVVYVTNERLLLDLRGYWQHRLSESPASSYLFLNTRGDRLTEATFRKRLRALSKHLKLAEHLTPHRFRHSAATLLIEEGVDIRIVQRLLGHASIATTELYTAVSDNSLVAAIERADVLRTVES